jgi:hypothetical protein
MSASGLLSKISATLLNSSKDAHLKNMSTIQTDEHLQALTQVHYVTLWREADRSARDTHARKPNDRLGRSIVPLFALN